MHYDGELKWGWWWTAIVSHKVGYYNFCLFYDLGSPSIQLFLDFNKIHIGFEVSLIHLAVRLCLIHLAIQWGRD